MQTNSVQAFIRFFIFILLFIVLNVFNLIISSVIFPEDIAGGAIAVFGFINAVIAGILAGMFYVLPEWERLVLLRLGKFAGTKGPGVFLIPPFIYSVARIVDIRITTQRVEATATLTKDNVPTTVTAAIEFRIEDPQKAVINVQNYFHTVTWLATEALKNTIGSMDLKGLLSNREEIAEKLKVQIDNEAQSYGIDVRAVRITDIDTPPSLVEELAVIARARRAAEAKQIQAQAEILVAEKVAEASRILNETPGGFKLRELQNLNEMSKEESSMIIIYPSGDGNGESIASSTAGANATKAAHKAALKKHS